MATAIDEDRLHAFVGKMLGDLGGGMSVPTVRLGEWHFTGGAKG